MDLGRYIAWNEGFGFTGKLEDVHRDLVAFAKAHAKEALGYFDVFLAGCLVKGNEVDDSGGEFGMFLDGLFQSWTRCCSAAGMKPADFIRKLAHWMKADDIGFCHDLEETVIPALSKEYRSELRISLEQRLGKKPSDDMTETERRESSYQRQSTLSTLKKLFVSTNNTTALIQTGEQYGFTPEDCLALATAFGSRGQLERALEWSERGLKCGDARNYELERLRRQLMTKTGRRGDAVKEAWEKFEQLPSIHTLEDVLECASKGDKKDLTSKALVVLEKADLQNAAEAFHELGAIDPLIRRIDDAKDQDLKKLYYSNAIPIAKSIAKKHPIQSARLYVAQALVVLDHKKSKAYHHAHDYLHEAKILFERAGEKETWSRWVEVIRHEHRLKSGFMPDFEEIAAGKGPLREPSFMERIADKLDRDSI